jgi:tRNA dimethylallyltransferase
MRGAFFLVGPTAAGKSSLAFDVAEKLGAEIVNADAFQIYRGLDVLTAKPNAEMQKRVPHHLLSAVELSEEMSAAKFRGLALNALDEIRSRKKLAIVVSGSGLYVKAFTGGFDVAAPPNPKLRAELSALSREELAVRLLRLDPKLAARTDLKNPRRVIRAIEIAEENSGHTMVIPSEAEGFRGTAFKVTLRDRSTPKAFRARYGVICFILFSLRSPARTSGRL